MGKLTENSKIKMASDNSSNKSSFIVKVKFSRIPIYSRGSNQLKFTEEGLEWRILLLITVFKVPFNKITSFKLVSLLKNEKSIFNQSGIEISYLNGSNNEKSITFFFPIKRNIEKALKLLQTNVKTPRRTS